MIGYVTRRILATIPVMAFVALFVFLLLRLAPGDPAAIIAGDLSSPEQIARLREALGLDRPVAIQFVLWLGQLLRGDLGVSLMSGIPVTRLIAERLEPTLTLALLTLLFCILAALPLGMLAAWTHNRFTDRLVSGFCVLGYSVPFFVIAYLLIILFALELRLLPVQGYRGISGGAGAFLAHQILPVLTLSMPIVALLARTVRASVLEVLGEDYVRTARAKGLPVSIIARRHVLRNAALPIITVIGNMFAILVGGVVVTESIFNLPGIGRLIVDAVLARDYPVIQGVVLFTSFAYVLLNLVIDLLYIRFDPRIAYR